MATGTREEVRVGEMTIRFLIEGEESGGSVAVFEFDVPAGMKVAAGHSHDGYEETIYGLEGVLTWTIEGVATEVGPGEALCIRRGAVHHFDNTRDIDAKALLDRNPTPTRADIAAALDKNLCRCGAHHRILRAVEKAAAMLQEGRVHE